MQAILKGRSEGGRFRSLADLCERVDGRTVNRKVLEALIKCGACDCLGQTRATLFAQLERTLARAASVIADRQRGQASLFGTLGGPLGAAAGGRGQPAGMAGARVAGAREGIARASTSPAIR